MRRRFVRTARERFALLEMTANGRGNNIFCQAMVPGKERCRGLFDG
jgi:hypothetical protein